MRHPFGAQSHASPWRERPCEHHDQGQGRQPSCLLGLVFKVNASVHGPGVWDRQLLGPARLGSGRPVCACLGSTDPPWAGPASPSVSLRAVRPYTHTPGDGPPFAGRSRARSGPLLVLCSGHQAGRLFVLVSWASAPCPRRRGVGPSREQPEGLGGWGRRVQWSCATCVSPTPTPAARDPCQAGRHVHARSGGRPWLGGCGVHGVKAARVGCLSHPSPGVGPHRGGFRLPSHRLLAALRGVTPTKRPDMLATRLRCTGGLLTL